MLFFGHLGVGATLVRPWKQRLPFRWVLVGAVLPDLIDKPLYYGLSWATGKRSTELGLISCTHTFGHTALWLAALMLVVAATHSPAWTALAAGDATHLLLDNLPALLAGHPDSNTVALLYPFYLDHFGVMELRNLQAHLTYLLFDPYTMTAEALGLVALRRLWREERAWISGQR